MSFRNRLGRRNDGEGCLARREDIRQEIGNPEASASRSQEVVCAVLPCCRRRIGTNSILAGARFRSNNRALLGMKQKFRPSGNSCPKSAERSPAATQVYIIPIL